MLVVMGVVEQRYEAVMAVLRDGLTVVEVAERLGVARQSVHRWIRRFESGGLAGLADRSHRPVSCPHQMPVEVEERVVAIRGITRDGGRCGSPTSWPRRAWCRCRRGWRSIGPWSVGGWSTDSDASGGGRTTCAGSDLDRTSCGRWT